MEESSSQLPNVLHEYIYQPLKHCEYVRLLRLHTVEEQVQCSLEQIPLAEAKFEALSYVWGSEEKPFRAIIYDTRGRNVGFVPLTRNLYDALHDLRHTPELKKTNFWIDQICIDQNGEEKNHQVKIMSRIYKSAARVIMYAGPSQPAELEGRGIRLLYEIDKHFATSYPSISGKGTIWNATGAGHEFPIADLSDDIRRRYTANDWKWLADLASGPWYDRLWMVQEQLANANITMLRGSRLLAWNKVAAMTILFGVRLLPQQYWSSSERFILLEYTVYSLWQDRQDRCFEYSHRTLLQNINCYGGLKCRDSRDYIYSLLGISSDSDKLSIYPDYSEVNTVGQLFHDITIRILKASTDLFILTQACRVQHKSGLPSWVYTPSLDFRFPGLRFDTSPHVRSLLTSRPAFSADSMVLALRGSCVDTIKFLAPKTIPPRGHYIGPMNDLWIQPVTQYLSGLASIMSHTGVTLPHAAALGRAISSAFGGLVSNSRKVVTDEYAASYTCSCISFWMHEISTYNKQLSPDTTEVLAACRSIMHGISQAMHSQYAQNHDSSQVDLTLRETKQHHQHLLTTRVVFCVSEKGRTGLVQERVMANDILTAFEGADRLFAIRPEGSKYRLIGCAYVDGSMNGEFYAGIDPNEVDEVIELI
ncbi:MAG: hypothetical protein M1822_005922 [Bathelium mastoideum]|nr:MAG: hypothetical protein M1822_005922 [Bathelium mastoideum]